MAAREEHKLNTSSSMEEVEIQKEDENNRVNGSRIERAVLCKREREKGGKKKREQYKNSEGRHDSWPQLIRVCHVSLEWEALQSL